MCGIAGAAGNVSRESVKKMLHAIRHRGPDSSGISSICDVTLGSVLLKITGYKTQPLTHRECALTYNGEIYNFREIARKLNIETDSDSEALFSLIRSKGVEGAIPELDGDYAFAYVENDTLYLARDPAGVKPLYFCYADTEFFFASEKKALSALDLDLTAIQALLPGYMLSFRKGAGTLKKVSGFTAGERIADEDIAKEALLGVIEKAVEKRRFQPSAIAFSGGLDSSIIAALSSDSELYSVGMPGSHDIKQTKKAAQLLGLSDKLHLHELTFEELEAAIPEVIRAVGSTDPMTVGIALPLFFTSRDAHRDGIRVMLSGQGADELFAGYRRYESMEPDELEAALRKDLDNIAGHNLERDDAVTMANSVELRVPFLDRDVVGIVLGIAPELKIRNGIRKYILRRAAEAILPDELVWKEKKAAQYSSGIYSALSKLARKKGYRGEGFLEKYLNQLEKN